MSYILISLNGLFIMTKLKVINVGPIEWFSPHFSYTDSNITSYNYDPLKENKTLIEFCELVEPDILFIFRGDLVRAQLSKLRGIYQLEFSSEIYPTNIFSKKRSESVGVSKFMHCLNSINPFSNIYHYDISRAKFFESLNIPMKYHFLPINTSVYRENNAKDIDILFFGRASERRKAILDKLKETDLKFVWIENGLDWNELSSFICRSKVIVNITAEDIDNFEPRILLGLANNSCVITEKSVGLDLFIKSNPEFGAKIRVIEPSSEFILKEFFYFKNNDFFNNKLLNFDILSSNRFILSTINK